MPKSKRKFYKTVLKVTILSEDQLAQETFENLATVDYLLTEGDCSGVVEVGDSKPVSGKKMAQLLLEQGSDPGFFGLDEDGNDEASS